MRANRNFEDCKNGVRQRSTSPCIVVFALACVVVLAVAASNRTTDATNTATQNDSNARNEPQSIFNKSIRENKLSQFTINSWDETPFFEGDAGTKLSRAKIQKSYDGVIQGDATLEYLMSYNSDGSAYFVGIERIQGVVSGRTGSFVLSHTGKFSNGTAAAEFRVLPGSGLEELKDLVGHGQFSTGHGMTADYEFEFSFE